MENQNERDEIEIDLVELFYVLWGHAWLILSIGLFCALSCFALSKFVIAPTYKSTTKIYILNKSDSSSVTYSDVQLGTQLTKDYTELINSRYVLEAVIQELNIYIVCRRVKFGFEFSSLKKHVKPILTTFALCMSSQIYINADMTMVGAMQGDYYTGLYSVSNKVYRVLKSLMAALYEAALPNLSNAITSEGMDSFKVKINELLNTIIVFLIPAVCGVIATSSDIIYVVGGSEYMEASTSLAILGFSLLFAVLSGAFMYAVLLPMKLEKVTMQSMTVSAVINIALNFYFMVLFGALSILESLLAMSLFPNTNCVLYVGTILAEFFAFKYCTKSHSTSENLFWNAVVYFGTNCSMIAYFIHPMVRSLTRPTIRAIKSKNIITRLLRKSPLLLRGK